MSDAQRYAVWPDPRSRSMSRALESLNSFHFQNLSPPPFTNIWELAKVTTIIILKLAQYLNLIGPDF